jgi:prolipoprotein diacylglyceryl transferase
VLVLHNAGLIASIPSPSDNSLQLGPLELRAYGVLIAIGALAAVWLTTRRWEQGGGDPEAVQKIAMWAIPAGVIGARLYHVITDFDRFRGDYIEVLYIWKGGLGIWGGVALGTLVGVWIARREGYEVPAFLDSVAPAVPLAQAIGRFGNWFNQELFGGPTDLPWGLKIDASHRPDEYLDVATFHPTFLYESLWNLALAAAIIWVVPRVMPNLMAGRLFAVYVAGYTIGRLWIELMRVDHATTIFGARVNVWMSILVFLGAAVVVLRGRTKPPLEGERVVESESSGKG